MFFLMIRQPPRSTLTYTLFPYTTLFRSLATMKDKRISPHTIRHTTAAHLLRAGVDINTIRAWLGHVSLDTTHIYAEVDLEMKAKALASVGVSGLPTVFRRTTPRQEDRRMGKECASTCKLRGSPDK